MADRLPPHPDSFPDLERLRDLFNAARTRGSVGLYRSKDEGRQTNYLTRGDDINQSNPHVEYFTAKFAHEEDLFFAAATWNFVVQLLLKTSRVPTTQTNSTEEDDRG